MKKIDWEFIIFIIASILSIIIGLAIIAGVIYALWSIVTFFVSLIM